VSKASPAPDGSVYWTGLRWVEAAFMQIERFEAAFFDLQRALLDADS
jgi:hypothetical protein